MNTVSSGYGNSIAIARLRRVAERLRQPPDAFLRTIPTKKYEAEVLQYVQDLSPVGQRSQYFAPQSRRFFTLGRTLAETGLRAGWRVERTSGGGALGIVISNVLETRGGKRGYAKLASIEWGSQSMVLAASRKTYTFIGIGGFPVRVVAGRVGGEPVKRPARPGLHITKRASDYIRRSVLPRLSDDIQAIALRRFGV